MNRRQRRAQQGSTTTTPSTIKSADDIPLSRPAPSTSPKAPTLLELAAQRQAQLSPNSTTFSPSDSNIINLKIGPDGNLLAITPEPDPSTSTPWLDTFFLATSLSALHFTLETLTVHQYAQELRFSPIVTHTLFLAFPSLFFLITLFHGRLFPTSLRSLSERTLAVVYSVRQFVLLVIANVAGCYLIALTNDKGYYAVMKNAPGIGTVWVWAILEMGLVGALLGVAGPGAYAWWYGYGIF